MTYASHLQFWPGPSLPRDWQAVVLKRAFNVTLGKMLQTVPLDPSDREYPYLRAANIQECGVDTADAKTMWFRPEEIQALQLKVGDLLVSEGGDVGRSAIWNGELAGPVGFQNSVNRVRPRGAGSVRFLYYWMSMLKAAGYIDALCNKATIAHLTAEKLCAVPMPLPSDKLQLAIATFLDRKIAQIDALIAAYQRLLTLLEEKRQAVITQAVTKGLDPTVPMKDSGVPWLGEMPAHWETVKVKYLVAFSGGGTPSRDNPDYWQGNIPWVSPKDMTSNTITDTEEHVTEQALKDSSTSLVEPGRVLLVVRSGILKHSLPIAVNEVPVSLNQDMKALNRRSTDLLNSYLYWSLRGLSFVALSAWSKQGATVESIEHDYLANSLIPVPPTREQEAISHLLTQTMFRSDQLISKVKSILGVLADYRSALITAAVTGQIDVREEEASDAQEG